jgi:AraC-like DNA-binding protein
VSHTRSASAFVSLDVESSRLFFLDPAEEEDFSVVFGGFENCVSDYVIDRKDFPWYSLEFVGHGNGTLWLDGVGMDLVPGSFFVYGPNVSHRIVSSPDKPLGKYFVGFTGSEVPSFLEKFGIPPGFASRCQKGEPIRRSFDSLIERGIRKSGLSRPLCVAITRQLLLMCRDDATEMARTDGPAYVAYARARDFIEGDFLKTTTLDAIARACEIDAPYLCRLFARYHDESPYQFLTRLRMGYASRLLLEGDATVQAVSAKMGFRDAFHFSRVFKSVHHLPPSRFRQSMHPQSITRKRIDETR